MNYLPVALFAGVLNMGLVGLILILARRMGWYDEVNERKIHTGKIPRLGGIGIFWAFVIGLFAASFFVPGWDRGLLWLPRNLVVLGSFFLIHLLGLVDDFRNVRALWKFLVELGAAVAIVACGFSFSHIALPWGGVWELGALAYPLTVLWIVGVTNAVNMIDGMDGLSGGISVIGAFGIALIAAERGAGFPAAMAIILVGALVGYLFYNFPPARIFMGDSGSGFLGFVLAVLPLLDRSSASLGLWFWDGITILLVPIFDVFAAIIRRKKAGLSIMSADRWHIHHKLMNLGFDTRSILVIVYGACMALGVVAATSLVLGQVAHLVLVLASWTLFLALFLVLHYFKERACVGPDCAGPAYDIGNRGAKE